MITETSVIDRKFFRKKLNWDKIWYITKNSEVTLETIIKAAVISRRNPFHNFGHQVGAAEMAARIAIEEGQSIEVINLVVTACLVHDAGHQIMWRWIDEIESMTLASQVLDNDDTDIINKDHNKALAQIRTLVIDTTFDLRGQRNDPLARIIQDADLAHVGQGVPYWMFASMGLMDEFNVGRKVPLTPESYIREIQEAFILGTAKNSPDGNFFLSDGAKRIFRNPIEDVKIIKNLPLDAIQYAYDVRQEDITLEDFTAEFNKLALLS